MNTITAAIIIISVLSAGCITKAGPILIDTPVQDVKIIVNIRQGINIPAPTPADSLPTPADSLPTPADSLPTPAGSLPTPTENQYPQPSYTPTLRPYNINKNDEIWHAYDPSSYITPENEWVKYYTNNTRLVQIQYRTDDEIYNYPPNGDVWQNADYTLRTMQGDCEDISIVWVSIHRAKRRPAVVVAGELEFRNGKRVRDFWYEYVDDYGTVNHKFVAPDTYLTDFKAHPKYMFNDSMSWRGYYEKWY